LSVDASNFKYFLFNNQLHFSLYSCKKYYLNALS